MLLARRMEAHAACQEMQISQNDPGRERNVWPFDVATASNEGFEQTYDKHKHNGSYDVTQSTDTVRR